METGRIGLRLSYDGWLYISRRSRNCKAPRLEIFGLELPATWQRKYLDEYQITFRMVESDAIEPFYYQTHDSLMLFLGELVSISQTFYKQLLGKKVLCAAFLYSQFVFIFFLAKQNWAKMLLVKFWWNWLQISAMF